MAIDFPNSPTNGQVFTIGTRSWTYNSSIPAWEAADPTDGTDFPDIFLMMGA